MDFLLTSMRVYWAREHDALYDVCHIDVVVWNFTY